MSLYAKPHSKVCARLAVTCLMHFWQNDRDLLRAAAVTRGWNGYRNKSQHRKSTLEKKILLPPLHGFEPATFRSRVRRSNHVGWYSHVLECRMGNEDKVTKMKFTYGWCSHVIERVMQMKMKFT